MCPASIRVLPNKPPSPPLYVPISYLSAEWVTNDPGIGKDLIHYPFGRPPSGTYQAPDRKVTQFRVPAESWAMTDCDRQLMDWLGYASTYYDYVAVYPVHSAKVPALRNRLYFDFRVAATDSGVVASEKNC